MDNVSNGTLYHRRNQIWQTRSSPERSEVPEMHVNLKDLYESDQAWNEEVSRP